MELNEDRYIGDGVYASYDGYHLVLRTGSHTSVDNVVYLDAQVRDALREILEKMECTS